MKTKYIAAVVFSFAFCLASLADPPSGGIGGGGDMGGGTPPDGEMGGDMGGGTPPDGEMGGDMGGGTPPDGEMGGDMGGGMGGGTPPDGEMGGGGDMGGMGGAFAYDSVISVTTNADYTLSRDSLVFGYETSLTAIAAGSGVTAMADGCFAGCDTLTTVDLSSSGMTEIPSDCFAGCTSLTSVTLPAGCTGIGANAFAGCSSLVRVTGGSVASVGDDAFRDCVALTTAPTNAASIGVCAFTNCPLLGTAEESASDENGGSTGNTEDTGTSESTENTENTGTTETTENTGTTETTENSGTPETTENIVTESSSVDTLLPGEASPLTAAYATTYEGLVLDGDETIGYVRLKVGKANKNTGLAKFAATAMILGRKKVTYSGKAVVDGTGAVAATLAKGDSTMSVTVAAEAFTGAIDGFEIIGARNVSASRESRAAEYKSWLGTYDVALETTAATGSGAAFAAGYSGLSVTVLAKGKARVKGVMADGTKVSVSGLPLILAPDGSRACADVVLPLYKAKLGGLGFQLWLTQDGSVSVEGVSTWDASVATTAQFTGSLKCVAAARQSAPTAASLTLALDASAVPATLNGLPVVAELLPTSATLSVTAGKLKATSGNDAKLSVTHNASTGLFKGKFSIFTQNGEKLKRTNVKFSGVMCGNQGYGSAVIKSIGAIPLTVK